VDSFEDLGTPPELVEALAAEGIESPTPLQESAVPLLRKGNNVVLAAGPGSGLMAAWALPLLDRYPPEGMHAHILVLAGDRVASQRLAESMARLAQHTGHSVAALGSSWVLPGRAQVLVGTPDDVFTAAQGGSISLDSLQALVVDQAQVIDRLGGLDAIERILPFVPSAAQRVLSALPVTPDVRDFAERHLRRAVTLPPPYDPSGNPLRGEVRYRVVPEPVEEHVADLVDQLLEEGARHALVFCRSEDRAADVGDRLTLRGYVAGAPGDEDVPVWLGVDALEARAVARDREGVAVVSCDVPSDPDSLDRRHSIAAGGVILVLAREVAHLKDVARRTGYSTAPFPPPTPVHGNESIRRLHDTLEAALESEDIGPYLVALAPLFDRHDPAEVAAAAVALLRRKGPSGFAAAPSGDRAAAPGGAPSWAKLFIGVGSRDGLVPGDLLGAVTGEADVPGEAVGRIDIKESHTLLEVHDTIAQKVIKALNGITIRGRAVRADFDRPRRSGGPPAGPRRRPTKG